MQHAVKKAITVFVVSTAAMSAAKAVPLRQVIRDCGADGKAYCEGVGYGAPMQSCLSRNRSKLAPACRAIIDRLDKGEEVEILG